MSNHLRGGYDICINNKRISEIHYFYDNRKLYFKLVYTLILSVELNIG